MEVPVGERPPLTLDRVVLVDREAAAESVVVGVHLRVRGRHGKTEHAEADFLLEHVPEPRDWPVAKAQPPPLGGRDALGEQFSRDVVPGVLRRVVPRERGAERFLELEVAHAEVFPLSDHAANGIVVGGGTWGRAKLDFERLD